MSLHYKIGQRRRVERESILYLLQTINKNTQAEVPQTFWYWKAGFALFMNVLFVRWDQSAL